MRAFGKLTSIFIVNIVLFLLIVMVVEVIFRVVGIPYKVEYIPNENSFARFDPDLGWSYVPNTSTKHKTGNVEIPVYFDRNGIRVRNSYFQLNGAKPSILFIGCSFTMGHGLSYEDSFVGKLDALEEVPLQVVNLGVQGYGSDQALLALKKFLPQFNTKIVVYTFIYDHILRNGNYDRRKLVPTARFLGTKPQLGLNKSNNMYLARKPLLYNDYFNSYLYDFLEMRVGSLLGTFPPFPEQLTKEIILEMKEFSNEHGAYFVVLNWRWTKNDYNKLFYELDVEIIDTMQDAPVSWNNMVLFEGIHPNAEAGDHAARLLFDYLHKKGLLID